MEINYIFFHKVGMTNNFGLKHFALLLHLRALYLVKLPYVETTMASWPIRSYYRGEEHSDDRFIIVFGK